MTKHTKELINKIRQMVDAKIQIKDIALKLDQTENAINNICSRNKIRKRYKYKYDHLWEKVLKYYITHTVEETCKEFKLTKKEFINCYETAIKKYSYRKDTRRKDKWTPKEILKMISMCGYEDRTTIAKEINRGNARVIKEKLKHLGLNSSVYMNGIPLKTFEMYFGVNPKYKTCKGWHALRLVEWSEVMRNLDTIVVDKVIYDCCKAMLIFNNSIKTWKLEPIGQFKNTVTIGRTM